MAVKLDRKNFMFTDKKDETLIKKKGDVNGLNFKIRNLVNCTVYLADRTNGLFIDDCVNCKIIVAPCDGSVMIRDSKDCVISIVAKQLRFRDCHNIRVLSYIESDPVVESCSEINFGPYNAFLPGQNELFKLANFTQRLNTFNFVYDFTPTVKTDVCHWRIINEQIDSEIVNLEGVSEEIEGLYPGYEQELQFYNQNGKLPYVVSKESVEGENIPIDTSTNKTVGETTSNKINIISNVAIDSSSINNQIGNIAPNLGNQDPLLFQDSSNNDPIINPTQNVWNQNPCSDFSDNLNNQAQSQYNYKGNASFNPFDPDQNVGIPSGEDIQIENNWNVNYNISSSNEHNYNNNNINAFVPQAINSFPNSNFDTQDPDELIAQNRMRNEEDAKRKHLYQKMILEENKKNELRNQSRAFLNNFEQKRQSNTDMRKRKNLEEEKVFIETRQNSRNSVKNPWDKVVSLIDLKESDYKGSKNIERMKQCIINRRYDVAKQLEKK